MNYNSTKKAFAALLEKKAISNVLKVERATVSIWKKRIKEDGVYPSEKTMIKFLQKAGAKIVAYKVIWQLKDAA